MSVKRKCQKVGLIEVLPWYLPNNQKPAKRETKPGNCSLLQRVWGGCPLTLNISTASARVRPFVESPRLPWSSCHSKKLCFFLTSPFLLSSSCCCLLSNTWPTMLSATGSGPLATSRLNMLRICLQSCPQNQSPSGSSCADTHNFFDQNWEDWIQSINFWKIAFTWYCCICI